MALKTIEIRKATEEDLPGILNLYAQPELDDGNILSLHEAKNLFKKMLSYPAYHIFIATIENKIVGTFALLIMDNLGHLGAPSGIVEDIAVDPNFQGQGIGKLMMNFAMRQCQEAGCYKLALSANMKRANAHKFYKSLGFKQHGFSFLMEIK